MRPTLSKSKVKRIGVFQKFAKTNENEVKPFKILQNRSKTNVFVSDCEEKEKRKNEASFFWEQSEEKLIWSFLNYRRFAMLAVRAKNNILSPLCLFVETMPNNKAVASENGNRILIQKWHIKTTLYRQDANL